MGKDLKGLFLAHQRELFAYLIGRLRDVEAAADLTQETFLRYAQQRQSDSAAVLHPRSYLYRIARNLAVDHVRQQARQRTDTVDNNALAQILDDAPPIEETADSRRRLEHLLRAIDELPERTRQIFTLARIDGLTHREVAGRLGISESSVQKHLAAALQHAMRRTRMR